MPTILIIAGWRLFFYSNEGKEPIHVHARKADAECKFWLLEEAHELEEAWSYGLTKSTRREIRKIIMDHFEEIVIKWKEYFDYF